MRFHRRPIVEDCLFLDVRILKRQNQLEHGSHAISWTRSGEDAGSIQIVVALPKVLLRYRTRLGTEFEWTNNKQELTICTTACHFGGFRQWWRCPRCGRRLAILYYLVDAFACRHCNNLVHGSRLESAIRRANKRSNKSRSRLGDNSHIKPKGMHWKTFRRLRHRAMEDKMRADLMFEEGMERLGSY